MDRSGSLVELASVLLACRERDTLLRTFVARVGGTLNAKAAFLWLKEGEDGALVCVARWMDTDERLTPANDGAGEGILASVIEENASVRLAGKGFDRKTLTHLPSAQRAGIQSALYVPFPGASAAAGIVEVLNRRTGEFTADDVAFLEGAAQLGAQADSLLGGIDAERNVQLETIERLTSLYDISRIFNSTLELTQLMPIVAGKIRDILHAGACNLWLVQGTGEKLELVQKAGEDPSTAEGDTAPLDSGYLGGVVQSSSPKLVENPAEDESLAERVTAAGEFELQSLICSPLQKDDKVIGVIELVNKSDGTAFNEDDLFFLASISEQAAGALSNANLLESERKLHELDALLKISQEITSTLDLDHVLTTVVHQASTVVPFDKCAIGFFDRNRFVLGAVSGETEVPKNAEMDTLRKLLEWISTQESAVRADQYEEGWTVEPESAKDVIVRYLEKNGYSGFYAMPLRDDQGTVGVLCMLSGDAEFLTDSQRETVTILANQTTVAIRNAQLYQQVPLAGLFQPLAQRKKKLLGAVAQSRWVEYGQRAALVAAVLILVPWPVRVGTNATVVPADGRIVSAVTSGIVQHVFVREGDTVSRDQILAQIDDSDSRVKLDRARTDFSQAQHDLAESEFRRDLTAASGARLRAAAAQADLQLEQERVAGSQLRAPIDGIVVTPKIENKMGTMLQAGDPFCELVETRHMAVDMNVPETDLTLVQPGKTISLKLNAFPTTTFDGTVNRIGARSLAFEGDEYFVVRAIFDNPKGLARDGMAGRARIRARGGWFGTGWYPVGYALFRSFFRWGWEKIWVWLP